MLKFATFLLCVLAVGSLCQGSLVKDLSSTVEAKLGGQLDAVQANKTQEAKVDINETVTITIPPGFERYGNRYFRIVYQRYTWFAASRKCRRMGGYLASFRNAEEITAITADFLPWQIFWLGLNDNVHEGRFVSEGFNKSPQFFKWHENEPDDQTHWENCVMLKDGEMYDSNCWKNWFFICQAEDETNLNSY